MVKRRKVKKTLKEKKSPNEKRMKDKDGEVAIARGRLAGALLKGILNRNTDDSDEQDSSCSLSQSSTSSMKKVSRESSPAQWKKQNLKPSENSTEDHQTYFMKLYDRNVDLAQFDINTPLYPICRAWIQNKPISSKKTENGFLEIKHDGGEIDSQMYELNEKNLTIKVEDGDVLHLPSPNPLPEGVQTFRVPSPIPHEIEEINLNLEPDQMPSRDELLRSHLKNWSAIRKRWRLASQRNEERYAGSKNILTKIYERTQVHFHA